VSETSRSIVIVPVLVLLLDPVRYRVACANAHNTFQICNLHFAFFNLQYASGTLDYRPSTPSV